MKRFDYVLETTAQTLLDVDKTVHGKTLNNKATYIEDYSHIGPVLVYCDDSLHEELKNRNLPLLVVDNNVNHNILRQLDQPTNINQYSVVVAKDKSAMRGLDYRSVKVKMALFVAKSFENKREAFQGFNRVGRFGDTCCRIGFDDVPVIDQKAATSHKLKLFKFVASMQKNPVTMKEIKIREATAPS